MIRVIRVVVVTVGRRDWPGSRHAPDERVETVSWDGAPPAKVGGKVTLAQATAWLVERGFQPVKQTSAGMWDWQGISGGQGPVESRRRLEFTARVVLA